MTTPTDWTWTVDRDSPSVPGVYAVAICFDESEGIFPMTDQWDGAEWNEGSGRGLAAFAGPFTTATEAEEWARAHDPEGL